MLRRTADKRVSKEKDGVKCFINRVGIAKMRIRLCRSRSRNRPLILSGFSAMYMPDCTIDLPRPGPGLGLTGVFYPLSVAGSTDLTGVCVILELFFGTARNMIDLSMSPCPQVNHSLRRTYETIGCNG